MSPAVQVKNAAHMELSLISYRCYEILRAYPDDADEVTRRRFSHGLGRELWSAMSSMGLMLASELGAGLPRQLPTLTIVGELFKTAEWQDLSLLIDVGKLDKAHLSDIFAKSGGHEWPFKDNVELLGPQWWNWPAKAGDETKFPAWWTNPTPFVARPMTTWPIDTLEQDTETVVVEAIASRMLVIAEKERETEMLRRYDMLQHLSGQSGDGV